MDVEFCLVVKLNVLAEFFGVNFYDGQELNFIAATSCEMLKLKVIATLIGIGKATWAVPMMSRFDLSSTCEDDVLGIAASCNAQFLHR